VRLVDDHCHLQADAFASDAPAVIAAARSAGIERLLVPGWDAPSSRAAAQLADTHDLDFASGIHPHVAAEADDEAWRAMVELVALESCVAIGETGLDYDRAFSPRAVQLDNLRRHLALAREVAKPAILHCRSRPAQRDAQDDLLRELAAFGAGTSGWPMAEGRPPAVLHSFSGPVDYGEQALAMGLAISFSGLVFRAGEEASAQVARIVPRERLMVETDSPYLSPPGAPRRRNEPRWVVVTAQWLAEQRGVRSDGLGDLLVANYDAMFRRARNSSLPPGPSRR
jgi:TatD DNase family protein